MSDIKTATTQRAKRPRPGSPLNFANPKLSHAETEDRLCVLARAEVGMRSEGTRPAQLQNVSARHPPASGFGANTKTARHTRSLPTAGGVLGA